MDLRYANKRERNLKYKNHLKLLYEDICGLYPTPVIYKDKERYSFKRLKSYYKRSYSGKHSKIF
jgi:hypothetical protein